MNDPTLGGFIDRRNGGPNLLSAKRSRRVYFLLHRAQSSYDAAITQRPFQGLAGAFGG